MMIQKDNAIKRYSRLILDELAENEIEGWVTGGPNNGNWESSGNIFAGID